MSEDYKRFDLSRHWALMQLYDASCCVEGFPASEHQTKTAAVLVGLREAIVELLDSRDALAARLAEVERERDALLAERGAFGREVEQAAPTALPR